MESYVEKKTEINGEQVRLFSVDGRAWFMRKRDAKSHERQRAKLFKLLKQSFRQGCQKSWG